MIETEKTLEYISNEIAEEALMGEEYLELMNKKEIHGCNDFKDYLTCTLFKSSRSFLRQHFPTRFRAAIKAGDKAVIDDDTDTVYTVVRTLVHQDKSITVFLEDKDGNRTSLPSRWVKIIGGSSAENMAESFRKLDVPDVVFTGN